MVAMTRTDLPETWDERATLLAMLQYTRDTAADKCRDLDVAGASAAPLPGSPLMTIGGVVNHLRWVEHCWFEVLLLDRPKEVNPQFGDVADADFAVADVPLADLVEQYERQCAVSDEITAATPLDAFGQNTEYRADTLTLRWILGHMVEETARHVGHLDLLREQLDGARSYR